jgi:hypothetical protein
LRQIFRTTVFTDDFTESTKGWEQNSNMDKLYLGTKRAVLGTPQGQSQSDVIPVPDFMLLHQHWR